MHLSYTMLFCTDNHLIIFLIYLYETSLQENKKLYNAIFLTSNTNNCEGKVKKTMH